MKTIFFEISMWLGIVAIILNLLYAILWLSVKVIDKISLHIKFFALMYEFFFYKEDYLRYMETSGKTRSPHLKKITKSQK